MESHSLTGLAIMCIGTSFLLLLIIFHSMTVPQFMHSSVKGCLGCFQVPAIMNKAAINFCLQMV